MNTYNIHPFFIECSKKYEQHKDKYNMLIEFAVGKRGIFITRVDKNKPVTYVVTPKGEFQIPEKYSDEKHEEFKQKWWGDDAEFSNMKDAVKESRKNWATTRKKDKIYLFNKFICSLDIDLPYKIFLSSLITFALLLKLYKPTDVLYQEFEVKNVNEDFMKKETFHNLNFTYDYSIPIKYKPTSVNNSTTVE
ncbi:MAG: hypothetical protein ACRDAQ_10855 [Cetobacterium sp.]